MANNFKKEHLRIFKTQKALTNSLSNLLEFRNFNQITVNELCDRAMVSRTAFYLHFSDKYDLLKYWLENIKPAVIYKRRTYPDIEKSINGFAADNTKKIKNLIEDAGNETSELLCDFVLSLLDTGIDLPDAGRESRRYTVLSEFCLGGLMRYLTWQVKNKFPDDLKMMNPYIYDILNLFKNKQL